MSARSVVIVGAGLAGSRCAETLRAEGFDGQVTLVGDEPLGPYERPALSKEFLAGRKERIELRSPDHWDERDIKLVLGHRVDTVNPAMGTIPGAPPADAIVIATGARARALPFSCPPGVHTLRTATDARHLREALTPGSRLAVIGAGFVGAEVASTARELGVEVTLIDLETTPLARVLGPDVGTLLADRYRSHGVDLRLGAGLGRFLTGESGELTGVELTDGSTVAADTALVAIGAAPACDLLGDARQGLRTDASGRTEHPGVYACGDVACAWRPSLSRHVRVEHWTSAAGQAAAVAHAVLGNDRPYDEVPYFWSDQFGLRLQHVGHAEDPAHVEIEGAADSFTAHYRDTEGRLLAALAANRPRDIAAMRRELAGEATVAAA
ncbi:MAG TPA: FAD-dependent oxidoreductase [Thermoleophilaceae bacterium]|nr:FAD-dependent oxidoreductase [Thermoleophilaceae bacterium]